MRTIRRRVLAGAVALFVATWLLIGAVLVSGHDPALAARKSSTAIVSSGNTTGSNTATPSGGATSTGASSGDSNAATSSVTTRQS